MSYDNFTIIGCGTLGSAIAYSLVLRSLDSKINRISLIDDDVLKVKNLPYLFLVDHLHQWIHKPKVFILKDILHDLNSNLEIESCPIRYPVSDKKFNKSFDDSYIIDCRDTKGVDWKCNMKSNVDGHWGSLILDPHVNLIGNESRYTIKNSRYYSMIMANLCVRIMMGDINLKQYNCVIDLRKEKFYDIPTTNSSNQSINNVV